MSWGLTQNLGLRVLEESARLLSAGTGAGGGTATIIPAAGSSLAPGRDPSAAPEEPRPEGEMQNPPGASRGWERIHLGEGCSEGGEAPAQR